MDPKLDILLGYESEKEVFDSNYKKFEPVEYGWRSTEVKSLEVFDKEG